MFRTLIYPSTGACDCVDELPHRSSCSQFVVCWRFCCGLYLVVYVLQAEAQLCFSLQNEHVTYTKMWLILTLKTLVLWQHFCYFVIAILYVGANSQKFVKNQNLVCFHEMLWYRKNHNHTYVADHLQSPIPPLLKWDPVSQLLFIHVYNTIQLAVASWWIFKIRFLGSWQFWFIFDTT